MAPERSSKGVVSWGREGVCEGEAGREEEDEEVGEGGWSVVC